MGANTSKIGAEDEGSPTSPDLSRTGSTELAPHQSPQQLVPMSTLPRQPQKLHRVDPLVALGSSPVPNNLHGDLQIDSQTDSTPTFRSPSTPLTLDGAPLDRPLPPLESRDTVKHHATRVTRWVNLDDSDDLYIGVGLDDSTPRRIATTPFVTSLGQDTSSLLDSKAHAAAAAPTGQTCSASVLSDTTSDILTSGTRPSSVETNPTFGQECSVLAQREVLGKNPNQSSDSRRLQLSHQPIFRRRLRPTAAAIVVAEETFHTQAFTPQISFQEEVNGPNDTKKSNWGFVNPFPDGFPLTEEDEGWLLPDPHPGSCLYQDVNHENLGLWGDAMDAANPVPGESTVVRDERILQMCLTLLMLEAKSASSSQPQLSRELTEKEVALQQAREHMIKEQNAGAERSRMLREKALQRRGLLGNADRKPYLDRLFVDDDDVDDVEMSDVVTNTNNEDLRRENTVGVEQRHIQTDDTSTRSATSRGAK
jgi:hypothetical protein